jgi:hypothetical protein
MRGSYTKIPGSHADANRIDYELARALGIAHESQARTGPPSVWA